MCIWLGILYKNQYTFYDLKKLKNMQNGLHDKDIKHLFIEIGKCGHKILSVMPSLDDVVLSRNWYDSKLSCIKLVEWFTFSWKWGRQQFKFMIYNTRSYEKIHWIHLIETFCILISYLERYLFKANLSSHILRIWRLGKFQQVFASKKRFAFHGCACVYVFVIM